MGKVTVLFLILGFVFLSSFVFAEEKRNTQPGVIETGLGQFDAPETIFIQIEPREDKCFFLDVQIWPSQDIDHLISVTKFTNVFPPSGAQGSAIGISYRTNQGSNHSIVNQSR